MDSSPCSEPGRSPGYPIRGIGWEGGLLDNQAALLD
jgi:hypothetical protein